MVGDEGAHRNPRIARKGKKENKMNQRGITCKVTKTDGKTVNIPVIVIDGYCTVEPSTKPYVTRELITLAGVSEAIANKKFSALTEQERKAVLRMGENLDGTTVVDC